MASTTTDAKVSTLINRHISSHQNGDDEEDIDALMAKLEDEDDSAFRAARMQQLSAELGKLKPQNKTLDEDAIYPDLTNDDAVLRFTTHSERCIVHFYHPDFARCAVMDEHMRMLTKRHAVYAGSAEDVKFARVNVKDASFVVEKLGVRVLPCVIGFMDGLAKGRIVGFEGVVWNGKERGARVTQEIEKTMVHWGVLERRVMVEVEQNDSDSEDEVSHAKENSRRGIRGPVEKVNDEDDWD